LTISRGDDIGTAIVIFGGDEVVRVRGLVRINDDRIRAAFSGRMYRSFLNWAVELRVGSVES
jgi:hypothetical protein